ncbi:MAG: diguanylate cyclase [Candidatus Fermentibacteraceae bacterium]|nr:diguanylate cyclase [Candidatus Fermentibacteraceae bacterium]
MRNNADSNKNQKSMHERLLKISNELKEQRLVNSILRDEINSLNLVFRNSVDILLIVDPETGLISRASDAVEILLGYDHAVLLGKPVMEILPDSAQTKVPEIMDGVFLDQKMKCCDGSIKKMDMTSNLVSENGHNAILLTFRDTIERHRYQREMKKRNSALDGAFSAMLIFDINWKIDYANRKTAVYWNLDERNIADLDISTFIPDRSCRQIMKKAIAENGEWEDDIECIRNDGSEFFAHVTATAVSDEQEMLWFVLSFVDITKQKKLEEQLREMSLRDELTGLYNRRGFMAVGQQLLESSIRSKPEIGLLFIDLDDLKSINDKFGHHAGDRAIVETANILRNTFRESDIAARIGGDELVALFLGSLEIDRESFKTRIRSGIEELNSKGGLPFKLSLSCGYASTRLDENTSLEELLSRADSLMYSEKLLHRTNPQI